MHENLDSGVVYGAEDALEPRFVEAVEQVLHLDCGVNYRPDADSFNKALSALQKSVRRFQFASNDPLIAAARDVVDKSWHLDESLQHATRASWNDFMRVIRRLDALAMAGSEALAA